MYIILLQFINLFHYQFPMEEADKFYENEEINYCCLV
jgi:hypothetical protein